MKLARSPHSKKVRGSKPWGLHCGVCMLSLSLCGFPPTVQNSAVLLNFDSKLAVGVNVIADSCLCLCSSV